MAQVLSDHFVREATEYLDELEQLLGRGGVPDAERIFRLARGIRGSAQVAQADGIAQVAARLEGAARFVLEGRIPWSEELRERAVRTGEDLRALLGAFAGRWSEGDDRRVGEAVARWGGFGEVAAAPPARVGGDTVFSFVRTELVGVVDVMERAAARLAAHPSDAAPVDEMLTRIRALRGVAGSAPLAPVLEVLDGLDDILRTAATNAIPVADERLEAVGAARAALREALGALEADRAPAAGAELARFRSLRDALRGAASPDADVVPIGTLLPHDGEPVIVSSPVAPAGRVAGDAAARFVRERAVPLLDRAEALVSAAGAGGEADTARRVEEFLSTIEELAAVYGVAETGEAVTAARAAIRDASSPNERRIAVVRLRERLDSGEAGAAPAAARGGDAAAGGGVAAPADDTVVEIDTLLLRGHRALEEAIGLRPEIGRLIAAHTGESRELRDRMDELWELLSLARSPG